jgi:hypothetical protein
MSNDARALEMLQDVKTEVLKHLHKFKAICEPVLDIEIRHDHDLGQTHTLRQYLDELEQLLGSGECVDSASIGGWIAGAFASVAGNFNRVVLRDAIIAFHYLGVGTEWYGHLQAEALALGLNPGDIVAP